MIGIGTSAPWAATRIDPEVALSEVRRLFPGVTAWAGDYTGSYWVMLDNALHEFKDPHTLIAWLHIRLSPPPRSSSNAAGTTPSRERPSRTRHPVGSSRPGPPRGTPDDQAALFDIPPGRWRRFLEGIRRFFPRQGDVAW